MFRCFPYRPSLQKRCRRCTPIFSNQQNGSYHCCPACLQIKSEINHHKLFMFHHPVLGLFLSLGLTTCAVIPAGEIRELRAPYHSHVHRKNVLDLALQKVPSSLAPSKRVTVSLPAAWAGNIRARAKKNAKLLQVAAMASKRSKFCK